MLSRHEPFRCPRGFELITKARGEEKIVELPIGDGIYPLDPSTSAFITTLTPNTFILMIRDVNFKCSLLRVSIPSNNSALFSSTAKNVYTILTELDLPKGAIDISVIDACGNFDDKKLDLGLPSQVVLNNLFVHHHICTSGHKTEICLGPKKNQLIIATDEPKQYTLFYKEAFGLRYVMCNLPSLPRPQG